MNYLHNRQSWLPVHPQMTQPSNTAEKRSPAELLPFCLPQTHSSPGAGLPCPAQLGSETHATAPAWLLVFCNAHTGFGRRSGCSGCCCNSPSLSKFRTICHNGDIIKDFKYPAKIPPQIITFRMTGRQGIIQTKQKATTENSAATSIDWESETSFS